MKKFLALFLVCALYAPAAMAQTSNSSEPLEISADKTLEWHRNDKRYIAKGKAVAQQGDTTIAAETLTADYREANGKDMDIYRLTAETDVAITSGINTAYGNHAVYDVDSGMATLTGGDLRMTSPEQTVTATDKFEYDVNGGRLSAMGNAKLVRGEDILEAPSMSAFFAAQSADGEQSRKLERMEATGGITITTPTEILTGDRGDYDAATNIATVTGNVKITRGQNILEGEKATVNLTTNVSTLTGNTVQKGSDGRVRGVFYPDDQTNEKAETAPAKTDLKPIITVIPAPTAGEPVTP